MPATELLDLVTRAARGDSQAFSSLHRQFEPRVLAQSRALLGPQLLAKESAEDVAQSVFVALHGMLRDGHRFGGTGDLVACLAEMTRHAVLRRAERWAAQRRDPRREQPKADPWEPFGLIAPGPGPATEAAAHEQTEILERKLSTLPPRLATLIGLRRAGLSTDEIAARLDSSPRTVRRHLLEGLCTLAQAMKAEP